MQGILGKKLAMTQIFAEDGEAIPVTVLKVGPCLVVQRKTLERDGYESVQLGLVEDRAPRGLAKGARGHFEKAGVAPTTRLREFGIDGDDDFKAGDQVKADIFEENEFVDVVGTSKGRGFQGVIKRHGYGGGRATHGSMFHRAPGSIGQASDPSRVFPGLKLPGQMGAQRVTTKNLRIVKVDADNHLIYVKGAVPGPRNGYVEIVRAKRG